MISLVTCSVDADASQDSGTRINSTVVAIAYHLHLTVRCE